MNSRTFLVSAAASIGTLSVAATIAALLEQWWLVTLFVSVLSGGALFAALDADRRSRHLRRFIRSEFQQMNETFVSNASGPPPEEVLGAVRVLQAQYVGRLDRLQSRVESALGRIDRSLPASDRAADEGTS